MSDGTLSMEVAQHPKLVGFLFTLCFVLSQAGMAAASEGSTIVGP